MKHESVHMGTHHTVPALFYPNFHPYFHFHKDISLATSRVTLQWNYQGVLLEYFYVLRKLL